MSHFLIRKILSSLFVTGMLGALALGQATTPGQPQVEEFVAEAVVPLNFVLSPALPNIPAEIFQQLQAGTLQARQRTTYSPSRNILTVWIFTSNPQDPLPTPSGSLPQPVAPRTISLFEMAPEAILHSSTPSPNILFAGRITSNTVTSPFGNLTGATAAITLGYDTDEPGTFTMLGGTVAGSHATFSPTGRGTLRIAGDDGNGNGNGGGTPGNRAPMVRITPVPSITTVRVLELDASQSSDPDGDPLTYQWRSVGRQAGISNANTARAQVQFGGEVGEYVFEVTVSDNQGNSSTERVTVTYIGN
jgi:hypothetical protein